VLVGRASSAQDTWAEVLYVGRGTMRAAVSNIFS